MREEGRQAVSDVVWQDHLPRVRLEVRGSRHLQLCLLQRCHVGAGFIDVKNAYQVFKRAKTAISEQASEKELVKTRISQYIQEKLQPEAEQQPNNGGMEEEKRPTLGEKERNWLMIVAQRVRCLHKDEQDPEEDED